MYTCIILIFIFIYQFKQIETSEDILAKYRKKPSAILNANDKNSSQKSGNVKNEGSVSDLNNIIDLETYSFDDAKKKLRLVLSTVDIQYVPWCNETESKPMVRY